MNLLQEKFKEVAQTLLPVFILVLLLVLTIVNVETDIIIRFIIGSIMLLLGLTIFLWGVDLSMNPIGELMSEEIATSRKISKIALLSFILGFLITVAEPDLLVLGDQIEQASGGTMNSSFIVYMVSIGVGFMISLGVFRLLRDKPSFSAFMAITYSVIFVLAIFVAEEFLAISFDASGATTGALTTPFILAISLGLSKVKGGKKSEENSFGLVGVMSSGPILAIMLISIISGQRNIQGDAGQFVPTKGILEPVLNILPHILLESLIALLPIVALFFIYNFAKFKVKKELLGGIIKGLVFTLIGLTLFLTGVNSGFMDMGRIIGMELAGMAPWILVGVAFVIGLIVVLVEPAVHVLGEQIEEVTSGHIPVKLIRMTLSLGVGTAIALSMVRILVPEVKLWYFLFPGFVTAIILSFRVDPIFVGIAYDAGGVASGPMTATFVLAFAQGAADMTPTANVLIDGFGVIAMVAMAPVLSIMILGTAFKHKAAKAPEVEEDKTIISTHILDSDSLLNDCVMVVVNRGYADNVIEVARQSGATGATIIRGRGTDELHERVKLPLINVELQPEKEVIWLVMSSNISEHIADNLLENTQLEHDGEVAVYISPTVTAMLKNLTEEENSNG
ncbi:MAG: DUF1538 domain-containing protein, partial [Clostridiales bacterium]|nr:DUF1538 domain-containing protein [Clostridiales bacterium]